MLYENTSLKIDEAEQIYKLLKDNGVKCTSIGYDKESVTVLIEWGDWEHDHAYAKRLITSAYPKSQIYTEITEEDGGDCYSAEHHIYF